MNLNIKAYLMLSLSISFPVQALDPCNYEIDSKLKYYRYDHTHPSNDNWAAGERITQRKLLDVISGPHHRVKIQNKVANDILTKEELNKILDKRDECIFKKLKVYIKENE